MADFQESRGVTPVNGTDDREAYPKFWIAAYTKPRSEKKAASELTKLGIETYVATQYQIRQWSDRKKKVEIVVIPSIIFAQIFEEQLTSILFHRNILKVITRPGEKKAAKIPSVQIDKLKFILGQTEIPVLFDPNLFSVHNTVRVVRGPLNGLEGEVIHCNNDSSELIVQIDLLGGARMTIDKKELELI
ncbi:MAG: UpxY family transcription antiterminator [Muribaculaceae bacterium]|nr:UpxY family transcription antiterminator [Muribaculaceae bacterium]